VAARLAEEGGEPLQIELAADPTEPGTTA
jgi:hypothetical protein